MKHQIKTNFFKFLSILPNKIGDYFYHIIQFLSNKKKIKSKIKLSESTYNILLLLLNDLKFDLKNKKVLEIGSGWFPIMPYFFIYFGKVSKVYTYDINEHYRKSSISKFNLDFEKEYNLKVDVEKANKYGLPHEVDYFPSKNIIFEDIPNIDIVFSRYVLSHVSPNDIEEMHKKIKRSVNKGTFIVHFISPSDLRQHGDKSISLQDFLQYSPSQWDKIQTRFDYHNRMRLPQFIELFTKLDLEIVYLSYDRLNENSKNMDLFKKLNLHEDYIKYSTEELTAGNIVIVLKV